MRWLLILMGLSVFLMGCSSSGGDRASSSALKTEPVMTEVTNSSRLLQSLPKAKNKLTVAVYDFQDKTGQHKPTDNFAQYSTAVTQGSLTLLVDAMLKSGDKSWFTVIERAGLNNLLQERKIIRSMREQYSTPDGRRLPDVGPLLYAGMIVEGGIVAYESNTVTGGVGARYLGIGGDTQYREDIVTVYLRVISVKDGQVLLSVGASKTIYSTAVSASIFKFVAFDELLEAEAGFTSNEPPQLAVRQAIEMAVYGMIMEGAQANLWSFEDKIAGQLAVRDYKLRKSGQTPEIQNYTTMAEALRKKKRIEHAREKAELMQKEADYNAKWGRKIQSRKTMDNRRATDYYDKHTGYNNGANLSTSQMPQNSVYAGAANVDEEALIPQETCFRMGQSDRVYCHVQPMRTEREFYMDNNPYNRQSYTFNAPVNQQRYQGYVSRR